MQPQSLHKVQLSILYALRHSQRARFSSLMQQSSLDSDAFKFHIRKLQKLEYIQKLASGEYCLTTEGKEFANNLDTQTRAVQKQAKLSLIVVASKKDAHGDDIFLCQQRKRNPYWGFWSFISGPIRWGVLPEAAAEAELLKQTGLQATCKVRTFYRKRDYLEANGILIEDKLFTVLEAYDIAGDLQNSWKGGHNEWLTREQLAAKEKNFVENLEILDMLPAHETYRSKDSMYDDAEY